MSKCGSEVEIKNKEEGRVLSILLAINFSMFLIEVVVGVLSESTALIADSLDMLADAAVYSIGLYAVGKSLSKKINAAFFSGIFQVTLGSLVILDVLRRFVFGSEPEPLLMILIGSIALVANSICLYLISKHRDGEVHMRASWIFSKNDVIANIGIIVGGVLVYTFGSSYPDLIIGLVISVIVIKGGINIIKDAKNERRLIDKNGT